MSKLADFLFGAPSDQDIPTPNHPSFSFVLDLRDAMDIAANGPGVLKKALGPYSYREIFANLPVAVQEAINHGDWQTAGDLNLYRFIEYSRDAFLAAEFLAHKLSKLDEKDIPPDLFSSLQRFCRKLPKPMPSSENLTP